MFTTICLRHLHKFFNNFTAINICGTDQDDCHSDATCINTGPGTYLCSCNEGFTGDGKNCISEC